MDYLNVFGLDANLVGAFFLAFSIKVVDPAKNSGFEIKVAGSSLTKTTIKKTTFRTGIILLFVGFLAQLIGLFVS